MFNLRVQNLARDELNGQHCQTSERSISKTSTLNSIKLCSTMMIFDSTIVFEKWSSGKKRSRFSCFVRSPLSRSLANRLIIIVEYQFCSDFHRNDCFAPKFFGELDFTRSNEQKVKLLFLTNDYYKDSGNDIKDEVTLRE